MNNEPESESESELFPSAGRSLCLVVLSQSYSNEVLLCFQFELLVALLHATSMQGLAFITYVLECPKQLQY